MEGAIKNYIVNYEVNSVGNASTALKSMAEQAMAASANLNKVVAQVKAVNSYVKLLSKNESLNNLWNIKPTVNLDQAKTGLRQLEALAQESASRIQGIMGKALTGVSSGNGLYSSKDKALIQAKMRQLENDFRAITNGRAKITDKTAKGRNGITENAAQLRKEYQDYAKQLASIQKFEKATQESGAATSLRIFVNRADDIKKAANRISNLTKSIEKFNTLKGGKTIRIDANIKPAMTKIQNLLNAIREGYAALNIGVTDKAVGKRGKEISPNGKLSNLGKANAAAAKSATITKATDAAKRSTAALEQRLLGNLKAIQETANKNTIKIIAVFNGSNAAFQLQQSLTRLQELANGRPINVTVRMAANAINTAVNQANAATAKGRGGSLLRPINLGVKLSSTGLAAQINEIGKKARDYANKTTVYLKTGVRAGALSKDIKNIASQAQNSAAAKAGIKLKATLQINAQSLSVQLSKVIAQLQAEADKRPLNIKSTLNGTNLLSQLNSTVASLEKAISKFSSIRTTQATVGTRQPAATSTSSRTSGARTNVSMVGWTDPNARSVQSGNDYYSRVRALWYPFTGNTSFGARTPMMVDMAKGMGAMFAVGGAMSAVGSSIRQAVQYQNQMRTTKAILENGTETYTPKGFVNMEKTVREVGKQTEFTAPDVANAARFMAMAGLDIPAINSAIRPIADVALIGDTDLGATADKLTNVMTTFGIAPEKMRDVADIMTSTFTRTNTDMMMLAESAKYAGGIANLYGGNFKNNFADIMAIFGVLGNAGIQASSAGTTVRMMYQNLMQPNKNQRKALSKYGIKTRDSNGQPLEMVDIIHQLHEKIPMNQMADAIGSMFRITAQPGAATLAAHVDTLDRIMQANRSAAGTNISGQIADEKKNTISGLWAQVTSTFTEAVVQAFENREGGWAGMLGRLRDYLAKPETIQMISKIIDLVENLAKTMAWFANVWAKAYSFAPKLINTWLHLQLIFTQIGYLATPIISLIGVFSTLRRLLYGVSAAGSAANASLAKNVVTSGATGMAGLYGLSPMATKGVVNARNGSYVATRFGAGALALEGAAMTTYEAAKSRKLKYELARNSLRNSVIYNGQRTAISPLWYATMGQLGLNAAESYRWMNERSKYAAFDMEGRQAAARRADAAIMRQQALMNNQLRAARRPEQLANSALMMRYASMYGGQKGANANWVARGNQIREANAAALAARRPGQIANKELMKRFYMSGGKGAFGMGMKGALQRGLSIGAIGFSTTSMFGGIKSAFYSLMTGLSKAVGLLISPVGLAVTGLALLGGAIYKVYNDAKKYKEAVATAENNSTWATNANKNLQDAYLNSSISAGGFKPVEVGYKKAIDDSVEKTYSLSDNKIVDDLLNKTKPLAGSDIVKQYTKNSDIYLPHDEITDYYRHNKDYKTRQQWNKNTADYVEVRNGINEDAQNAARKLGVIAQWGKVATEQDDVKQALADLQKALYNGDQKRVREIMTAYHPTSTLRMNDFGSAKGISEITDPTKYYEWQYAQYQALQNMLNNYTAPSQYYQSAVKQIKSYKGLNDKERKVFDGTELAQTIIQAVPIVFNGTMAAITLDKMGRVDWSALSQSVNDGIPLNIQQEYDILQSVYDAIYNDPNIRNVQSLIELLNHYLPEIANERNPYNYMTFGLWPENNIRSFNNGENAENETVDIPAAPKPRSFNIPSIFDGPLSNTPQQNDFLRIAENSPNGYLTAPSIYKEQYPYRFPSNNDDSKNGGTNIGSKTGITALPSSSDSKSNQKDYANTYNRNAARPTQVVINIDKLANFDRTMIAKGSDERAMAEAIETKLAEAIMMLTSAALNEAGSLVSQGVS